MDSRYDLPLPSLISSSDLSFLNEELGTEEQLKSVACLVTELESQCFDLDKQIEELNLKFHAGIRARDSSSIQIDQLFTDLFSTITQLRSSSSSDYGAEGDVDGLRRAEQIYGEELPSLAKEVSRVETVRVYAETALKLDVLVGEIEDAAASFLNRNPRLPSSGSSQELHYFMDSVKAAEDALISITNTCPHWTRMISAVDGRVDRSLAIVRPQAISDHRALLSSLGWPPPLGTLRISNLDSGSNLEPVNPLTSTSSVLDPYYCHSFISLCNLQQLQWQRRTRQLKAHNPNPTHRSELWVMEELVNPIWVACQHHFSKWVETPHFIFALVYRILRDYFDSMDDLLQPLVDQARLSGYSCGEEWVAAMVSSLSTYTAKEVIPGYIFRIESEPAVRSPSPSFSEWLHLVDSMISFEISVRNLLEHSGIPLSLQDEGDLQRVSLFSVFCDSPTWIPIWAKVELSEAMETLRSEMDDPRKWKPGISSDSNKSPAISGTVIELVSSAMDRSRLLPSARLRAEFIAGTGAVIVEAFAAVLLLRCQEAEGLTALAEDRSLLEVANCLNGALGVEQVLRELGEDFSVLKTGGEEEGVGIFEGEVGRLEAMRAEWVGKVSVSVMRGFGAKCTEYVKSRRRWREKEGDRGVSDRLLDGLDYLQGRCVVLEEGTNRVDFTGMWRKIAEGVDGLFFGGLFGGRTKFYNCGVERIVVDMEAVFRIFGQWCLRPEGFFGKIGEAIRVLRMEEGFGFEESAEEFAHLSRAEVERILRNRVFC